jgi:hypothetical protein
MFRWNHFETLSSVPLDDRSSDDGTFAQQAFTTRFELDDHTFEEPSPNLFSFNNPLGVCRQLRWQGSN